MAKTKAQNLLLFAPPGDKGIFYQPLVHLYKKLIFLKAKLLASFFIATASETQTDFAPDWLFPFCFGRSFIMLHRHLCADQRNAFRRSLWGEGALRHGALRTGLSISLLPARELGFGGEDTGCAGDASPGQMWAAPLALVAAGGSRAYGMTTCV